MGDNNCSRVLLYGDARAGAGSLAKKNKRGECVGAHHDCPLWPSVAPCGTLWPSVAESCGHYTIQCLVLGPGRMVVGWLAGWLDG